MRHKNGKEPKPSTGMIIVMLVSGFTGFSLSVAAAFIIWRWGIKSDQFFIALMFIMASAMLMLLFAVFAFRPPQE